MLDFHTHILPSIDDGSKSVEESLLMLKTERQQGVNTLVLTPHFYPSKESPASFIKRRKEAFSLLNTKLEDDMPKLLIGAELQYFEGISRSEELEELKINEHVLLLEMPFSPWSEHTLQEVIALNGNENTQIVLAHIERYLPMQSKNTVEMLVNEGVLIQANTSFFIDWRSRRKAKALLKRGLIHIIGSDCHNMSSRCPNWNKLDSFVLEEAEGLSYRFMETYLS